MTPDSTADKRRWDKFHLLASELIERGAVICVVGSGKDVPYVESFLAKLWNKSERITNMAGRTTLDELVDLLRECDLLVCVNSFVMHLGVALGVKMFAIVGATEPKVVLPPGVPHAYSLYAKDISLERVMNGIGYHTV